MMAGYVPHEVIYRKDKKGFEAPSSFWTQFISQTANQVIGSKILKEMIQGEVPKNKEIEWRLANISLWERAFNVIL
jgi:hypothetical protein